MMPLVPLTCAGCTAGLPAMEEDVAFACLACRSGYELRGNALAPVPLRLLPMPPARAAFHLPFWSFAGDVRVPAFNTWELLPLARRFSDRPLAGSGGKAAALVGASLSSSEAWRVAAFAGLVPEGATPREIALLGLPFLDEGNRLLDLATGLRIYKESIDRSDALITAARGGG